MSDSLKPRFRAVSPDRRSAFEILPGYTWQTASDPMMQQILRQAAASGQGCDLGPVLDSGGYLRQGVLRTRQPNARLISHEPMPAVSQAKQEQLAPSFNPLIRAGWRKARTRFHHGSGRIHGGAGSGARPGEIPDVGHDRSGRRDVHVRIVGQDDENA